MNTFSTEVLVVGASPVGLALAVELAGRGHAVQVIEKADRIGRQPRAKTTNVRSMEHMRRWGLAKAVRAASPLGPDFANRVVFATGLFGKPITAFENSFNANRARDPRYSEAAQWIPQYEIERVLLDQARTLPSCSVSFNRNSVSLSQESDGVTAQVVAGDSGTEAAIRARYLIGADGAGSTVRKSLGIAMEGDGRIANFLSLVLRIPGIGARHLLGDALMYWLINPASPCVVGPMDRDDTWFWGTQIPPDTEPDMPEIRDRVAKSLGPDIAFEVLVTDLWAARKLQAQSYGSGRVCLAGDACHLHPLFGGYGMNLGIADAVDLGWKLSAMLEGWGGEGLLASYEAERRPIHKRVIDESVENMAVLAQHFLNPDLDAGNEAGTLARANAAEALQASKDREFHSLGLVIGYDYAGSPIVMPDGRTIPPASVGDYTFSASPGRCARHSWLSDGSSLFDHFGTGFTLLCLENGSKAACAAIIATAYAACLPLKVLELPGAGLFELYQASLVLIRPDQHVAWRGDQVPNAASVIAVMRGA